MYTRGGGGGVVRASHKDQGRYLRFTARVLQRPALIFVRLTLMEFSSYEPCF